MSSIVNVVDLKLKSKRYCTTEITQKLQRVSVKNYEKFLHYSKLCAENYCIVVRGKVSLYHILYIGQNIDIYLMKSRNPELHLYSFYMCMIINRAKRSYCMKHPASVDLLRDLGT